MQIVNRTTNILRIVYFLIFCCVLSIIFTFYSGAANVDSELTAKCNFTVSGGQKISLITDNSHSTKIKFAQAGLITVTANEQIAGVYIIWDKPPGMWTLDIGDKSLTCGTNNFIHEYIKIDTEATELKVNALEGSTICDVRVFGTGDVPSDVQIWQPPYEKADMVLLPTHADDEHLYFGGTMPLYAGQLGLKLQVVYLTNHWGQSVRPHELLNGLWTVGITAYPIMSNFNDTPTYDIESALKIYDKEKWIQFQVEIIRRFKPSVILGHDINGEYGHGAHILNTQSLMQALEISSDPTKYPESAEKYGVWDVPKTYLHIWPKNQIKMNWDIPLEKFGGKTAFQMAEAGYNCHKSQHIFGLAVGRKGYSDCQSFGLYRTTVGLDIRGGNFFENIDTYVNDPVDTTQPVKETQPDTTVEDSSQTVPAKNTNDPTDILPNGSTQTGNADTIGKTHNIILKGMLHITPIILLSSAFIIFLIYRKRFKTK